MNVVELTTWMGLTSCLASNVPGQSPVADALPNIPLSLTRSPASRLEIPFAEYIPFHRGFALEQSPNVPEESLEHVEP